MLGTFWLQFCFLSLVVTKLTGCFVYMSSAFVLFVFFFSTHGIFFLFTTLPFLMHYRHYKKVCFSEMLSPCCSGILIQTLADASNERHTISAPQIVLNVVGFCATVATTILFTVYAKRQLKVLQGEELLQ